MTTKKKSNGLPPQRGKGSHPSDIKVTRKRLWTSTKTGEKRVYIDILLPEYGVTLKNWALLCDVDDVSWEKSLSVFASEIRFMLPQQTTTAWLYGTIDVTKQAPVVLVKRAQREGFKTAVLEAADTCPWKVVKARVNVVPTAPESGRAAHVTATAARPELTAAFFTELFAAADAKMAEQNQYEVGELDRLWSLEGPELEDTPRRRRNRKLPEGNA